MSTGEWWAAATVLVGIVGVVVTIGLARRKRRDERVQRRRELVAMFVRSVTDLQDCVMNPTRNKARFGEVESATRASVTALLSDLDLPAEAAVSEFVQRVHEAVRYSLSPESVWGDQARLGVLAGTPLLRWVEQDPTYPVGWFEHRVAVGLAQFKTSQPDIEPDSVRRSFGK